MLTAVATASFSGRLALQGRQAARGLELWAADDGVRLEISDDGSSPTRAYDLYRRRLDVGFDIVLGPYGSNLVRRIAPLGSGPRTVIWNHGGAADDLARPHLVSLPAPASTYFHGTLELAHRLGLKEVVVAAETGRFAAAVASGARKRARELGIEVRRVPSGEWAAPGSWSELAVLFVGSFAQDVANVARLRSRHEPGLLGCVAAGLRAFVDRLGPAAERVVGPVQWVPRPDDPEVGPSGEDFALRYEARFGNPPDYVAAQAAAAGFLAAEANRRGYDSEQIRRWKTSTLLGGFTLDESWRQIGHVPTTVQWRNGRRIPAQ